MQSAGELLDRQERGAVSLPPRCPNKERGTEGEERDGEITQRRRGSGRRRSRDIRMMVRGRREGRILCSNIAGLAPGELVLILPAKALSTLKDT